MNDRRAGMLFSVGLDLQVLIGLLLSIFCPLVASAVRDMGAAMASDLPRPIVVEHVTLMLLALVLVHVGVARARNAGEGIIKHRQAALWFTFSTVAILAAIPWGRPLLRGIF